MEDREIFYFKQLNAFGWPSRNLKAKANSKSRSTSGRSGWHPEWCHPARLRRALGKAEPVFPALRLRLGLETLSGSLSLSPTPSVLANATSKDGIQPVEPLRACIIFHVFSTINEGVAGGGRRLPSDKHRLPLPLEGVCLKTRAVRGFRPGGTAAGGSPIPGI